jgi:hypothetical protein
LAGAAALASTAIVALATAGPASAAPWHRDVGWGAAGLAAGVVGGAIAVATSPLWAPGYYAGTYPYAYAPGHAYAPSYAYTTTPAYTYATGGRDDAYCAQRYRSYDPATGTYLGYDGIRHACS